MSLSAGSSAHTRLATAVSRGRSYRIARHDPIELDPRDLQLFSIIDIEVNDLDQEYCN